MVWVNKIIAPHLIERRNNMNKGNAIGKLPMHYALKNHITIKILVPDSLPQFSQLVPANKNRSAT